MGKRGPKPTPTKLLKLRGSWRGKRNPREPEPAAGVPDRPTWLTDEALQVWDQVAPDLLRLGVLTRIDGNALARYCQHFARYLAAEREVSETGTTVEKTSASGEPAGVAENPAVRQAERLSHLMLRFEQEFGLTPSARSGIHVEPKKDDGFKPRIRSG